MMYTPANTPRQPSMMATKLQEQIDANQEDIQAARQTISALEQKIAALEQFRSAIVPTLELLSEMLDPDQRQQLLVSLGLVPA